MCSTTFVSGRVITDRHHGGTLEEGSPLAAGFFSCLRLGGFLANDCHCGPQEQDDQDCLGEGFQENLLSYYWFSPSARRTRKRWLFQVRKDQLHSLMQAQRDQR